MWGRAYRLSGRLVGPKKRVYYQLAASNLVVQEWSEFLSLAGHQGGNSAQVEDRRSLVVPQRISWQKSWVLGFQDYVEVSQRARSFHVRKAVPSWEVPREFWTILFTLTRGVGTQGWGVGYTELSHSGFGTCFCCCGAVRLINIVEEMGNSSVGTLLERRHSWSFCSVICIWISTWPISSRSYHSSKGDCSSGSCGWAQLCGLQQGC